MLELAAESFVWSSFVVVLYITLFFLPYFSLQRQREAAELALNGGEGQQKEIEEPEEEM